MTSETTAEPGNRTPNTDKVVMSKDTRIILRFAVLGFVIAAIFFGLSETDLAPGSFLSLALGGVSLVLAQVLSFLYWRSILKLERRPISSCG